MRKGIALLFAIFMLSIWYPCAALTKQCTQTVSVMRSKMLTKLTAKVVNYRPSCSGWTRFWSPGKCSTRYRIEYKTDTYTVFQTAYKMEMICCPGTKEKDGECQGCPEGKFGDGCMGVCSCHGNQYCSQAEGDCSCKPGWIGMNCTEACPYGFYGNQCTETCLCKNNATCDHQDGSCSCLPGWTGTVCEKACDSGLFGANCNQTCHCGGRECDHVTGACFCDPGKYGALCASDCPKGTYGQNCASKCQCTVSTTQSCDVVNGTCHCMDGWVGTYCAEESEMSAMKGVQEATADGTLIGVIVGVVALIILILIVIAVVCLIRARRNRKAPPHDTRSADSSHELTSFQGQTQDTDDYDQRYAEPDVITDARPRLRTQGNAEYEYISNVTPELQSTSPTSQKSQNLRLGQSPPCAAPVRLKSPPRFRVLSKGPHIEKKEPEESDEKNFANMEYFMGGEALISGNTANKEQGDIDPAPDSPTLTNPHEYSEILGEEMTGKKDKALPPPVPPGAAEGYDVIRLSTGKPSSAVNAYNSTDDMSRSVSPDVNMDSEYSKLDHTGTSFKRQLSGNLYGHLSPGGGNESEYTNVPLGDDKYDTLDHAGSRQKKKVLSGSEYDTLEPFSSSEMQI